MNLKEQSRIIDEELSKVFTNYSNQLNTLSKERSAILERVEAARAQGDLTENSEYTSALDDLIRTGRTIQIYSTKLEAYNAYKQTEIRHEPIISIGSMAWIVALGTLSKEYFIKLVPTGCGVPQIGAIAVNTALGKAILNAVVGSEVEVQTPMTRITYKIMEVY